MKKYKIKEFADLVDSEVSKIRYYDSLGLFKEVVRDENNYRLFTESNIKCFHFVEKLTETGMSLEQVRFLKNEANKSNPDSVYILNILNSQRIILDDENKFIKNKKDNLENIIQDMEKMFKNEN